MKIQSGFHHIRAIIWILLNTIEIRKQLEIWLQGSEHINFNRVYGNKEKVKRKLSLHERGAIKTADGN